MMTRAQLAHTLADSELPPMIKMLAAPMLVNASDDVIKKISRVIECMPVITAITNTDLTQDEIGKLATAIAHHTIE